MKITTSLLATASLITLSACASIVSGSTQKMQVTTSPASQSSCTVANKLGNSSAMTPSQTQVSRSKTDLLINCVDQRSGYAGTQTVESSLEPWLLGNILFGGIIGAPIDFATGAAWQYPKEVTIPLTPTYQPTVSTVPMSNVVPSYAAPTTMQPALSYAPAGSYTQPAAPASGNYIQPAPQISVPSSSMPTYIPAPR